MENIKWSKKKVVVRPHLDRYGRPHQSQRFDVNVYRWKNYRLEKELYGENRLFYHLVRMWDQEEWESHLGGAPPSEWKGSYSAFYGQTPLYLCDYNGSYHACFFRNIKEATRNLQYICENGNDGGREWVNPREKYVWGVLAYKPKREDLDDVDFDEYLVESVDQTLLKSKRKKPLLFWDGVDRKIKLNKSLK